jgi:transposase
VDLSIEERVFLIEYVFRESSRYTDLVQDEFVEKFLETPVPHRNAVRRLIEKFRETGSVLDAERSGRPSKLKDNVFANKLKRVQACIDVRGHHFQHLL